MTVTSAYSSPGFNLTILTRPRYMLNLLLMSMEFLLLFALSVPLGIMQTERVGINRLPDACGPNVHYSICEIIKISVKAHWVS